jgi:hypothetical protein
VRVLRKEQRGGLFTETDCRIFVTYVLAKLLGRFIASGPAKHALQCFNLKYRSVYGFEGSPLPETRVIPEMLIKEY